MKPAQKRLGAKRLRGLLVYEPETGDFRWRTVVRRGMLPGDLAGTIDADKGRRIIRLEGKTYFAHVLAWRFVTGRWPPRRICAKVGNLTDCRFANLELCDRSTQQLRATKPYRNNSSGYRGVSRTPSGRFVARLLVNGVWHRVGTFDTAPRASRAYNRAKKRLGISIRAT